MQLNERSMKKILKEEYDKRIDYFLNEKITIIDKRGVNVLQYAKGLKVLDQAGNQYTFDTIVTKGNEEFSKLYLPDEPREDAFGEISMNPLQEDDRDEVGFYSRLNPESGRKEVSSVEDGLHSYDSDTSYSDLEPDDARQTPKLPERKYILVPMGEFEQRFRLKSEEE